MHFIPRTSLWSPLFLPVYLFGVRICLGGDWLIEPSPFVAKITATRDGRELELANGLVRRVIRLQPAAATVAYDNVMTSTSLLRSVRPEAIIELDGKNFAVGGLTGQPIHNYLGPEWLAQMSADPRGFQLASYKIGRTEPRFAWQKHPEWLSQDCPWPPPGAALTLLFQSPTNCVPVTVAVHYEIYDGLPLISKWLTISNGTTGPVTLDRIVVEQLALVEPESIVDGTASNFRGPYRNIEVFSDYSFGGDMTANADAPAIHWNSDPLYATQVHYERKTPCLLECFPQPGPVTRIQPGEVFESFRIFWSPSAAKW